MWDNETGFYYDIDKNEKRLAVKTIAGYWPLLAEIPNDDKAERIISRLLDPAVFRRAAPLSQPCRVGKSL